MATRPRIESLSSNDNHDDAELDANDGGGGAIYDSSSIMNEGNSAASAASPPTTLAHLALPHARARSSPRLTPRARAHVEVALAESDKASPVGGHGAAIVRDPTGSSVSSQCPSSSPSPPRELADAEQQHQQVGSRAAEGETTRISAVEKFSGLKTSPPTLVLRTASQGLAAATSKAQHESETTLPTFDNVDDDSGKDDEDDDSGKDDEDNDENDIYDDFDADSVSEASSTSNAKMSETERRLISAALGAHQQQRPIPATMGPTKEVTVDPISINFSNVPKRLNNLHMVFTQNSATDTVNKPTETANAKLSATTHSQPSELAKLKPSAIAEVDSSRRFETASSGTLSVLTEEANTMNDQLSFFRDAPLYNDRLAGIDSSKRSAHFNTNAGLNPSFVIERHALTSGTVPTNNDVLVMSKSSPLAFSHIGNRRFRVTVEWNLPSFFHAGLVGASGGINTNSVQQEVQSRIIQDIISVIGDCDPPGRFLVPAHRNCRANSSAEEHTEEDISEIEWTQASRFKTEQKVRSTFMAAGRALGFYVGQTCLSLPHSEPDQHQESQTLKPSRTVSIVLQSDVAENQRLSAARKRRRSSVMAADINAAKFVPNKLKRTVVSKDDLVAEATAYPASRKRKSVRFSLIGRVPTAQHPSMTLARRLAVPAFAGESNSVKHQDTLTKNDVLCSQDEAFLEHVGNCRFRVLVEINLRSYIETGDVETNTSAIRAMHLRRSEICSNVIQTIAECHPPGRFMRWSTNRGKWAVVDASIAQEYVAQFFRQRALDSSSMHDDFAENSAKPCDADQKIGNEGEAGKPPTPTLAAGMHVSRTSFKIPSTATAVLKTEYKRSKISMTFDDILQVQQTMFIEMLDNYAQGKSDVDADSMKNSSFSTEDTLLSGRAAMDSKLGSVDTNQQGTLDMNNTAAAVATVEDMARTAAARSNQLKEKSSTSSLQSISHKVHDNPDSGYLSSTYARLAPESPLEAMPQVPSPVVEDLGDRDVDNAKDAPWYQADASKMAATGLSNTLQMKIPAQGNEDASAVDGDQPRNSVVLTAGKLGRGHDIEKLQKRAKRLLHNSGRKWKNIRAIEQANIRSLGNPDPSTVLGTLGADCHREKALAMAQMFSPETRRVSELHADNRPQAHLMHREGAQELVEENTCVDFSRPRRVSQAPDAVLSYYSNEGSGMSQEDGSSGSGARRVSSFSIAPNSNLLQSNFKRQLSIATHQDLMPPPSCSPSWKRNDAPSLTKKNNPNVFKSVAPGQFDDAPDEDVLSCARSVRRNAFVVPAVAETSDHQRLLHEGRLSLLSRLGVRLNDLPQEASRINNYYAGSTASYGFSSDDTRNRTIITGRDEHYPTPYVMPASSFESNASDHDQADSNIRTTSSQTQPSPEQEAVEGLLLASQR